MNEGHFDHTKVLSIQMVQPAYEELLVDQLQLEDKIELFLGATVE